MKMHYNRFKFSIENFFMIFICIAQCTYTYNIQIHNTFLWKNIKNIFNYKISFFSSSSSSSHKILFDFSSKQKKYSIQRNNETEAITNVWWCFVWNFNKIWCYLILHIYRFLKWNKFKRDMSIISYSILYTCFWWLLK